MLVFAALPGAAGASKSHSHSNPVAGSRSMAPASQALVLGSGHFHHVLHPTFLGVGFLTLGSSCSQKTVLHCKLGAWGRPACVVCSAVDGVCSTTHYTSALAWTHYEKYSM